MSKINETNYPRRTQANYEDTDMFVIQKAGGNTYTTRIEDLREDCQETLAPALNTMRENLATIEGGTASKAYAKGDYLVFGGRLCKAKTSIAVNATLILDTNIELASVGDELSSISSDLAKQHKSTLFMISNVTVAAGPQRMAVPMPADVIHKRVDGIMFACRYDNVYFNWTPQVENTPYMDSQDRCWQVSANNLRGSAQSIDALNALVFYED